MIEIKTADEIAKMRKAGLLVAKTLDRLRAEVRPGISTAELDAIAEDTIRSAGGVPSFLGYRGFPATICASVNDEVVHGIPGERRLESGDVFSIDCGAILDGWHGDSAITVGVGPLTPERQALVTACENALWAGLAAALPGGRLSDISHAVEQSIRSVPHRYGIVQEYGGHGIGTQMHQDPHLPNYGKPGRGPRLVPGLALAVEPMLTLGSPQVRELADGWTVSTKDGSFAAHWEHTVAITPEGPWVLTATDGGAQRLGEFGITVPATT